MLEKWGVLGASRTDGEPAVEHGFMVAAQSDRGVPIPGRSWGEFLTPVRSDRVDPGSSAA